jgi:DNA-binding transcriptional ArsR family regulator
MKALPPRGAATPSSQKAAAKALRRAEELADLFKMLGNANRVKIVVFLNARERSVADIEAELEIRQPTLSQQLGELRDAGLILGRREAKSVIYALTDDLGRRALDTIYLANGHPAPQVETGAIGRVSSHQAAVFASVLSTRGSQAPELRLGFKSPLQG